MNTTSCESGLLKIGDLVRLTGKTPRTLHFYEELGLLRPVSRTKGGFRLYGEETLLRVRWTERLQELGFSCPRFKTSSRAFKSTRTAPRPCSAWATSTS